MRSKINYTIFRPTLNLNQMKVKLNTCENTTKDVENIREKVINCADTVIDNIDIMQYVYDEFGHDLDVHDAERIADIVYGQIKLRM